MNIDEAKVSSLKLNSELFSLNPSALITLFRIDISDLAFDKGLITDIDNPEVTTIFRFHNNLNLTRSHIIWRGVEYVDAPIMAEGSAILERNGAAW